MKRSITSALIGLLILPLLFQSVSAEKPQGKRVGNIRGIVEERKQKDEDRSVAAEFKSDAPINKVVLELPDKLLNQVKLNYQPENWVMKKDEKNVILTGPPLFDLAMLFEFPKQVDKELDKFLKKPIEYQFFLGNYAYGSYAFVVKHTEPITPVTPDKATQIPSIIRPDTAFSITPNEGYTQGTWKLKVGDFDLYEYREDIWIDPKRSTGNKLTVMDGKRTFEITTPNLDADFDDDKDKKRDTFFLRSPKRDVITIMDGLIRQTIIEIPTSPNQNPPPPTRTFVIPGYTPIPSDQKVYLVYENQFGEITVEGPADTKLEPKLPDKSALAPPFLINCTPKVIQGNKICVCGFFPNLFTQRQLLLDGQPLGNPLSGSTDMVTFWTGHLTPGRHVITWNVPAFDYWLNPEPNRVKPSAAERVEFIVLKVDGSIDREQLFKNDAGTDMHLKIIGTEEPIEIKLENKTPNIIKLEGGILQMISTSGGADNRLKKHVDGIQVGNFNIEFTLTSPPCPCNPEQTVEGINLRGEISDSTSKPSQPIQTVDKSNQPLQTVDKSNPQTKSDSPSDNQTTKKAKKPCDQILLTCSRLTKNLFELQSKVEHFQKAADDEPGDDNYAKSALEQVDYYLDKITEVRGKMLACLEIYDNCIKGEQKEGIAATGDAVSPPSETEQKPENLENLKKEDCDKIHKDCRELVVALEKHYLSYAAAKRNCNDYSEDETRFKTCLEITDTYFKRVIGILEAKLKECETRQTLCRQKFGLLLVNPFSFFAVGERGFCRK